MKDTTTESGEASRAQKKMRRVLSVIVLIAILLAACGGPAQVSPTPKGEQDWRTKIAQVPLPSKGCFTATSPNLVWKAAQCTTPENIPYPPARRPYPPATGGPGPFNVGNGNDYSASVTNLISSAVGSFSTVTNVTSETENDQFGNPIASSNNAYSLQLNSSPFATSVCTGYGSSCQGWVQFIYSSFALKKILIQYWLLNTTGCPSGWTPNSGGCFKNGPTAISVPTQPVTNLSNMSLTGDATAGGNDDVKLVWGTSASAVAPNSDSFLNLAAAWNSVEFTIVGDCCLYQAAFNTNATIDVRTTVHHGSTAAPTCVYTGYTGETNNLNLVGTGTIAPPPSPALESDQSNSPGGSAPGCATANGLGDTHLRTFSGLFYDFQATGDFLLAQTQNFQVQTRQVSGAPTWPNAAINQAVAAQLGNTQVALCAAAPVPLVVDGKATDLSDGQTLSLPSGGHIRRTGNVYLVIDHSGNSMRAVMNGTWIDVSVGLGRWPTLVRGLLANPTANVNQLEATDGTVYNTPIAFNDLYGHYGDSWRVLPGTSLLSACGGSAKEVGKPTQFFFAHDLPQNIYTQARGICTGAGVKDPALLDACTLDVAVLGNEKAAAVYVGLPAPVAVGELGQTKSQ